MAKHKRRGKLRRGARRTGEEVADEAIAAVAWRVVTAPFRFIGRAFVDGFDLGP